MQNQIDYEALARQFGAKPAATSQPDYDALAKRYGATPAEAEAGNRSLGAALRRGGLPGAIAQFGSNAFESGGRFVGDVAHAVMSPVQTAKAVGNLALGTVEKVIPGEQEEEKNVDALVNMYIERYGGLENLKKTMFEDPVGFLADVATVAGGIGLAGKGVQVATGAAKLTKTANVAAQVAKTAGAVSGATDPLAITGRAVAAPVSKLIPEQFKPRKMYESALKPSTTIPVEKVNRMVETGLENRIPVTEGGLEKLGDLVDDLQIKIADQIKAGTGRGETVSALKVAQRTDDATKKFSQQVNPAEDLNAIAASKAEFLDRYAIKDAKGNVLGYRKIPAAEAQALKQGTYRQLKGRAYGELKSATIEAQKALARGLKEELANAFPELAKLNEKESKLLGLESVLERAVRRIDNHQLFGIGTPIATAGVHAATGSKTLALIAGVIRGVLDNPQMKSRLATWIYWGQKKTPGMPKPTMATAASRVQEYIDSLGGEQSSPATPAQ